MPPVPHRTLPLPEHTIALPYIPTNPCLTLQSISTQFFQGFPVHYTHIAYLAPFHTLAIRFVQRNTLDPNIRHGVQALPDSTLPPVHSSAGTPIGEHMHMQIRMCSRANVTSHIYAFTFTNTCLYGHVFSAHASNNIKHFPPAPA